MEIAKTLLVDLVRAIGAQDQAARAETLLPDPVDVDRDAQVLVEIGLDRETLDRHLSPQARSSDRVGVAEDAPSVAGAQVQSGAREQGSAPSHG